MKIAYIADGQCNHGAKWVNYFAREHDVILLTVRSQQQFPLYVQSPQVKIYPVLPDSFPVHRWKMRSETISGIRRILHSHDTALVHAMYAVPYAFWAYLSKHRPFVVTTRGSDVLLEYRQFMHPKGLRQQLAYGRLRELFRESINAAAYVTSTSSGQQEILRTFVRDPAKLHLVRTGVDVDAFLQEERTEKNFPGEYVIFSNRAMAPLYNIDVIVRAFHRLVRQFSGKKLRLVTIDYYGDASYAEKIRALVRSLGLGEKVTILPAQSPAQLRQCYRDADVVVMIPDSDGTAVSGVEALLSEKPLIIGRVKYDEDLFNSSTCWKIGSNDEESLSRKLEEIMNLAQDSIRTKTSRGREAAMQFADARKETGKLEELYRSLL